MNEWLQEEWRRNSAWQLVLRPLAWVFGALIALRRLLYRSGLATTRKLPVAVIVVGNITVGGTGKTPLVIALAQLLRLNGLRPGIVSRGFGAVAEDHGDFASVEIHAGDPMRATPDWFGDEPVMMAARLDCPVYVGADRPRVARALLKTHPEVNVLIADDGLQHYALQRDVEIAVIDGVRGFGNGALLPAGPLREPLSRLDGVNAIVVNGGDPHAYRFAAPAFEMRLGNEQFVSVADGNTIPAAEFVGLVRGRNLRAVAGIGNPQRFFEHLGRLGIHGKAHAFPDHHAFRKSDLNFADTDLILMTEKDAVKCRTFADQRMWFMRVDAQLPAAFGQHILSLLGKA
jgi:tetraacyldisaccharide 4'-kinase